MDSERDDVEMSSTAEYTISQACRFKAERDEARQRLQGLEEWTEDLEDSYREAWRRLVETSVKEKRLGKLVWRLQNRLARAHRREKALRKGMHMWREKAISGPVRTVSAYDLLPEADLDTLHWVREQGGLGVVKTHAELFQQLKGERDELRDLVRGYEKRGAYDMLSEVERLILELWPRYEDGTIMTDSDLFIDHQGSVRELDYINMSDDNEHFTLFTTDRTADRYSRGERVKRPVMDAEGNRIEQAMDVWWICEGDERGIHAEKLRVDGIDKDGMVECSPYNGGTSVVLEPSELYVHKPVLDAEGVPIKKGDTVYLLPGEWCGAYPLLYYSAGDEMVVKELNPGHDVEGVLKCVGDGKYACFPLPYQLAHTKPEQDSWERIADEIDRLREDVAQHLGDYLYDEDGNDSIQFSMECVAKRCRALADRERGE